MVTALNVYGSNAASTTLPTAGLLVNATGASGNGQSATKVGTSTGFGEVTALGTTANWLAYNTAGAITDSALAPTGNGWLFDVTTLEGQQIANGTWSPIIHAKVGSNTATATMYVRAFRLASDLVSYTLIGSCSLAAQSLTTTMTQYTLTPATLPAMPFGVGDKLYIDVWFNITATTIVGTSVNINFTNSSSATQGRATHAEIDTPGYSASVTANYVITDAGLDLISDGLTGLDNPLIKYIALGTSNTTPTSGDTRLGNEVYRQAVTTLADGANPGEVVITAYIGPTAAVGVNIAEVGFFGGNTATAAANSGILLAHGLYTLSSKTNLESLQVTLDLTI